MFKIILSAVNVVFTFAFLENTIDSFDPEYKSFEPLHQPKDFPWNIRSAVDNWMLLPEELRSTVQYTPCFYKSDADEKFTCEDFEATDGAHGLLRELNTTLNELYSANETNLWGNNLL
jgi:hypothetical protein